MKNQYSCLIIIIAILLIAVAFIFIHGSYPQNSASINNNPAILPDITTPAGWYNWGTNHYPDYETSTIPNSATFGTQSINNSGNNTTTLIVVNVQSLSGKTDEQWIDTVLYPDYVQALATPSSTMLWNVINGKLTLEAVTQTPAGGYNLYDYVFDDGTVYSFDLNPWHSDKDIANSPDALTLRTMVQSFAKSLSSATAQ